MSLEIIIGADVVPTASNLDTFQSSAPQLLFGGLGDVWNAADLRVFNLETPLADAESAESKCGPHLLAPTKCAEGLAALNPTGICLCNNHILDHGAEGFTSTKAALKAKHLASFGAGEDTDEADKPFVFAKHGVRIAVYAVCEHEFSCATERTAGANPLDLVNLSDRIREIKTNCDRLIVLYHGGKEGYAYPTPMEQKVCRKIAECGASLVLSQGSHTVGCSERWNNTTIVYGQGSLISGEAQQGLLVRYTIGDYGADTVGFVPVIGSGNGAAIADETASAELMEEFQKRSLRVRVEGFVPARFESLGVSA